MSNFTDKAIKGIKWTSVSVISNSLIRILQVSILTRYLSKADFGTIAIASLFIGFTELFIDMGLSVAIIHKQNIPKNHYSSLFWLNVITGLALLIILLLFASVISGYYKDDSLTPIIQWLSLNVFFSSVGRQHKTLREKKLDFKMIALTDVATNVLTFCLAVILALKGFGVYSLVYSTVFGICMSSMIYLTYGLRSDRNITLHFKLSETLDYLKIGIFQIGSNFLDYFSRELDILIISSTMGRDILGVYSLCKKIVIMIYSIISPIMMRVLIPMLAEIQDSVTDMRGKFSKLMEIGSTTNYLMFFMVALMSPWILRVLYGNEYVDYYMILSLLAISYGILSVSGIMTASQVAMGRTDIGFYWTIYGILSKALFIYIGSFFSIIGIVTALLVGTIINLTPFWYIQIRTLLKIPLKTFLGKQFAPFIVASSLFFGLQFFIQNDISFITMSLVAIGFIIVYVVSLAILTPNNFTLKLGVSLAKDFKAKYQLRK